MAAQRAGWNNGGTSDGKRMAAGGERAGQAYTDVNVFNGSAWEKDSGLGQTRRVGACGR